MSEREGRLSLGYSRALVLDILRISQCVPAFPVEKWMDLSSVAAARAAAPRRISWVAIFTKAFALVAREIPAFRRSYVSWPWPHLYQHAGSVATISINREDGGEQRLFWHRMMEPENISLTRLQRQLDRVLDTPVSEVFRQQLQFAAVPAWLRRLVWWGRMNLWPSARPRWLGTFAISVLASHGCYNRRPPHFLTTCLTYGPLDDRGRMPVTLLCDHRVLDGITSAQGLVLLEEKLRGQICRELLAIKPSLPKAA